MPLGVNPFREPLGDKKVLGGKIGVGGQIDAQPSETGFVAGSGHVGHVHLAAVEGRELLHGQLGHRVGRGADAQGDQRFHQVFQ